MIDRDSFRNMHPFRSIVYYPYLALKKVAPSLAHQMKKAVSGKSSFSFYLRRNIIGPVSTSPIAGKKRLKEEAKWISNEIQGWPFATWTHSVHASRIRWIKSFPKADVILDLGGSAKGFEYGALIAMGYPYDFKKLIIVDLPLEERHRLYQENYKTYDQLISYKSGQIHYCYSSMSQLKEIKDGSVDLVNSGQSIEHITEAEAAQMLQECWRVLKSGGTLCIDTPNAKATRVQQDEFIDPDHKIEYTHAQLSQKIIQAGFQIVEAKGMNWLPQSISNGLFDLEEVSKNCGIFDDIENCYLLAYRCRKI